MTAAEHAVEVELNGIGDNPMVLIERDTLLSNGNFQPMQLALAFDALRTGAAHVAMISERRMNKLTTIRFSDPALMLAGLDDEEMAKQSRAARSCSTPPRRCWPSSSTWPPRSRSTCRRSTSTSRITARVAPSVVFTTRRALDLLDTILTCEAQMAIDLMDAQGVPAPRPRHARGLRRACKPPGRGCPPAPPAPRARRRAPPCASRGAGHTSRHTRDAIWGLTRLTGLTPGDGRPRADRTRAPPRSHAAVTMRHPTSAERDECSAGAPEMRTESCTPAGVRPAWTRQTPGWSTRFGPRSLRGAQEASTSACSGRHESVACEPTPGALPSLASSVFCATAIMRAPGAISIT